MTKKQKEQEKVKQMEREILKREMTKKIEEEQKRKQKRKEQRAILRKVIIGILILIIILIGSIMYGIYNLITNKEEKTDKSQTVVEEEIIIEDKKFSLIATGDAVMHSPIYNAALQSNGSYDFSDILTEIIDVIEPHNLKFINVEAPFADKVASSYPKFNTPSEWGDNLIDAGFNMFSLANNHSNDQGTQGVLDTVEFFDSKTDIVYSGMNNSEESPRYVIGEENGIVYGYVAYAEHTNGLPLPTGKEYLVNMYDEETAKEDIEYLKQNTDIIIVSMHWGDEYTAKPNEYQKEVANELAELGVDIILGNHPHWVQPIEIINDTVVIYSMGNFISNQMSVSNQKPYTDSVTVGAMVSMDIIKSEEETRVENINVELIYSYKSTSKKFKVVPFSKMNVSYDDDYVALYEKHKEVMTSMSDIVNVTPLS